MPVHIHSRQAREEQRQGSGAAEGPAAISEDLLEAARSYVANAEDGLPGFFEEFDVEEEKQARGEGAQASRGGGEERRTCVSVGEHHSPPAGGEPPAL